MDMEYLSEFTVIAKLESYSRAAEELCISQSSLSKHILALERELGAPLLVRNSRNVTLSPLGAELLPMATQVAELKNRIMAAAGEQTALQKSVLRIASIPVMAQYDLTGLLARFQRDNPQLLLDIQECERQELQVLLENGTCELAFARRGLEPEDGLEYLEIYRDKLVAVVPVNHPLAKRETLTLQELRDENLLFLDQQTGFHHLYTSLCRGAGFVPHISYTGHRPENLMELAAQNMGIALLMERHTDYYPNSKVKCLEITPSVESDICLVHKTDRPLKGLAQSFWAFVEKYTAEKTDSTTE